MILDDGGDATLLVHLGVRGGEGRPRSSTSPATRRRSVLYALIKRALKEKPGFFAELAKNIKGVTEETTTGVHRLYQMAEEGRAAVPRDQRQRLGHQVEVRQPLRLPRVARRTASSARPT